MLVSVGVETSMKVIEEKDQIIVPKIKWNFFGLGLRFPSLWGSYGPKKKFQSLF